MCHYRLYFMTTDDHVDWADDIACGSDAEAVERASGLRRCQDIEIWQGRRRVARVDAAPRI